MQRRMPPRLNPVVFRRIAHHDEQVVGRGIAVRRAADQFPEQQDIFGIEIAVGEDADDLRGFGGIVKTFDRLFLHGVLIRFHVIDC